MEDDVTPVLSMLGSDSLKEEQGQGEMKIGRKQGAEGEAKMQKLKIKYSN